MLSLFQVAGGVAGIDVMYAVIDGTTDGNAPQRDAHPERALFFIVFTVIGKLFALNLVTGAVIDNYNRMKMRLKGMNELIFFFCRKQNFAGGLATFCKKIPWKLQKLAQLV